MKTIRLLSAALLLSAAAQAQTPVWSTDVAPIVYNRCATCHHSGGIAPFNLMSYSDAVAQASAMAASVQSGEMPPWPPDPAYNHLAHERVLSAAEKAKIVAWAAGGTPRGNAALEPPTPTFSTTGDLPGTPNLVLKIPAYTSPAVSDDVYRCFVLPTGISADKFITAFEAIPGNRAMVHHVLVYADSTGTSTSLDAADPGPGYTSFGGIGTSKAILLGGWVPGSSPIVYPSGFGSRLPKNAKVVLQIHYPAGTAGMKDSTEVHFFFSASPSVRDVYISPVLNHSVNINTPLFIPANTVRSFTEQQAIPLNFTLLGIAPHMHLLAQNIESFGIKPNGDTQRYISIPEWDFHWQGFYLLKQAMKVESGTTVYANATYDNTTSNPENPSNPPQNVQLGESTTDEMMLVYFVYSNYQAGDENIVMDTTSTVGVAGLQPYYRSLELLQPYPVPAKQELVVKYYSDKESRGTIELLNVAGQLVMTIADGQKLRAGYTATPIDVSMLADGVYTLRLTAGGEVRSRMVSIQH